MFKLEIRSDNYNIYSSDFDEFKRNENDKYSLKTTYYFQNRSDAINFIEKFLVDFCKYTKIQKVNNCQSIYPNSKITDNQRKTFLRTVRRFVPDFGKISQSYKCFDILFFISGGSASRVTPLSFNLKEINYDSTLNNAIKITEKYSKNFALFILSSPEDVKNI